jgi:hypothetical protein
MDWAGLEKVECLCFSEILNRTKRLAWGRSLIRTRSLMSAVKVVII